MKVLIVDDSDSIRKIICGMLRELGLEVLEASHGVEALAQLSVHPDIGLVTLDWNMPKMNGMEFLEALKTQHAYRQTPTILMVTTENEKGKVVLALTKGAHEYIMKPFTKEVLQEKLALLGIQTSN